MTELGALEIWCAEPGQPGHRRAGACPSTCAPGAPGAQASADGDGDDRSAERRSEADGRPHRPGRRAPARRARGGGPASPDPRVVGAQALHPELFAGRADDGLARVMKPARGAAGRRARRVAHRHRPRPVRCHLRAGGAAQAVAPARGALAEPERVLPAPRHRRAAGRLAGQADVANLQRGSGPPPRRAVPAGLVDHLAAHRRRPEQGAAAPDLPAPGAAVLARGQGPQEVGRGQADPRGGRRDAPLPGQPGAPVARGQGAPGRRAGAPAGEPQGARGGHRAVGPGAPGRPHPALRPAQLRGARVQGRRLAGRRCWPGAGRSRRDRLLHRPAGPPHRRSRAAICPTRPAPASPTWLRAAGADRAATLVEQVVALEAREEYIALGDTLPPGLRLVGDAPAP